MVQLASHIPDHPTSRVRDALVYIRVLRPVLLVVSAAAASSTWILQPGLQNLFDIIVVTAGFVIMLAAVAISGRVDPERLAMVIQISDVLLIVVLVFTGRTPDQVAPFLLLPIIGVAYFGTARATLLVTAAAAIFTQVASLTIDAWADEKVVSSVSLLLALCGSLVAFITGRARVAEHLLELDAVRDRVALRLARSIRLSDDPTEAIHEVARTLGTATGAASAMVMLFEHDEHYVAEAATWTHPDSLPTEATIDAFSIDATLRHLVASGHGAWFNGREVALLQPADSSEALPQRDLTVESSLRALLSHVGAEAGVIVSLPMGGRAIGAIVLTGASSLDWDQDSLPLLDSIAPQLAAGLAQVVLVRDQRDALDSLERVDRMRDRLIAHVSHELRTPLTSTIGFIETLLRPDLTFDQESQRSMMQHARDGGLRLLALVEDLRALGSTRPETIDLAQSPVRLSTLLEDSVRGLRHPADRRVELDVVQDALVLVDRNRMLQVLSNVVVNALHHGAGDVQVRCAVHDSTAVIDVLDHGEGVAAEHVNELFLPFARFSTRTDSTGLGLAICRSIVEAHSGAIDYERVGECTRFRITLPMQRGE